jgi:predicted nucleic acid-binding protein
MPKIVIADTSCLIVLDKIEQLEILQLLYSEVLTTPEVAKEFGLPLPRWISVRTATETSFQNDLTGLDSGEASAISLALSTPDSILVLDDLPARKVAEKLSINFTGTLGLLAKGKASGYIHSIKPILKKLREINFRISPKVEEDILIQCNEQ